MILIVNSETILFIFRALVILLAGIMVYFSYKIYKNTHGASRGWLFLSISGGLLAVWTSSAVLVKYIGSPAVISALLILETLVLFILCFIIPYSYSKLADDFRIPRPKWLTTKSIYFVGSAVIVSVILVNFFIGNFSDSSVIINRFYSIAHWSLSLCVLYACITVLCMVFATRKALWVYSLLFFLIVAVGMNTAQYYYGCCWTGGELHSDAVCSAYNNDYVSVSGVGCSVPVTGVFAKIYQPVLLVGIVFGVVSLYLFSKQFSKSD